MNQTFILACKIPQQFASTVVLLTIPNSRRQSLGCSADRKVAFSGTSFRTSLAPTRPSTWQ